MNKQDLAQYLVNLHFLMDAQDKNALSKSKTLGAEYEKHWNLLKDTITKETKDETRTSNPQHRRLDETRTDKQGSEPRRG